MDSDAGQVSNCVEKKLADVFLVHSDRSEHKGSIGGDERRKEEKPVRGFQSFSKILTFPRASP